MANTFNAGVHPADKKGLSSAAGITVCPQPETVYLALAQHLGKPAIPVVEKGMAVKAGQLIARADGEISAPVFSSVSGTVADIVEKKTVTGYGVHIVIKNDFKNETFNFPPLSEPSADEIKARVKECGIVGLGGAGFPTAVKIAGKGADVYIINGAECEPYITCDYRIMLELTEEFIAGACMLSCAAGVETVTIAIEENKPDAIAHIQGFLQKNPKYKAEVCVLKTKYPQGAEKQLIYAVTKRKVPLGKLPLNVGVLVSNVHTALSTYYAVKDGRPLYKRVMTVSGKGVKKPSNMWVPCGTLYKDIIAAAGGLENGENIVKMISGGPMMGFTVDTDEIASTKTTGSLLLLTKDEAFTGEPNPCINCGKCAKACPMRLMPMYIDMYALAGNSTNAVKYGARNCIECGCCAFVCPAKRPLVQSIRLAKKKVQSMGGK